MAHKKLRIGYGREVPPAMLHVEIYFYQKGAPNREAALFYATYEQIKWKNESGVSIKNWKVAANEWIWRIRQ